jgi:protease I
MLNGTGLVILASTLKADRNAQIAFAEMAQSKEFINPIKWSELDAKAYDGILLPGGHARGMKEYLESKTLQKLVSEFFSLQKLVVAICHGVVLAARSNSENGKSVLYGKKQRHY